MNTADAITLIICALCLVAWFGGVISVWAFLAGAARIRYMGEKDGQ